MKTRLVFTIVLSVAVAAFLSFTADAADVFPAFKSRTLSGDAVTSDIFANKKLTMINIWATWCPPCVAEMPDLGRLGSSMPEGAQLVGIVYDVSEEDRSAKGDADRILSQAKAGFVQIEYSPDMNPYLDTVDAIPTTIFVDSKGAIVGEPMVGSNSEKNYRSAIEKILKGM
ncbi:MAG: TlpA family protein disulfide reductase [Synergistaceae bacterium]|jgi:thiol-disulfide isomerase/thioredoxin|nr:TlpA family protein disulfide reductase [Synergistaceae bacterium]